ncbi:GSCOCG00004520001-RA-CDS [Cotesia congregata]|uniref:Uncharacterized protein n=1 Tax=Cotesia congregata TaxID=51543 RepID=A0A8J2HDG4_COTCN|nr:GSCOCG00004520001-RA-CDS [Cotesia congregata]CAG5095211.1 Protein of unknown function [Cotesia congregata]
MKSIEHTAQFLEKMINSDKSENDSPGNSSRSEDFDKLKNVNDSDLIVAPISEETSEVYIPVENEQKKCNDRFDVCSVSSVNGKPEKCCQNYTCVPIGSGSGFCL